MTRLASSVSMSTCRACDSYFFFAGLFSFKRRSAGVPLLGLPPISHAPFISDYTALVKCACLSTLSHSRSPAVREARLRLASNTKRFDNPSQFSGSPYLALIAFRFSRKSQPRCVLLLFRPLHFAHEVTRFSSVSSPPLECASLWSSTAPSSSNSGEVVRVQCR